MIMPFGKYKGCKLDKLPSSYLLWLASNIEDEHKGEHSVCLQADEEWNHREQTHTHFE